MTQITLVKGTFGYYYVPHYSDTVLRVLATFLCLDGSIKYDFATDPDYQHDFYIEWLKNTNSNIEIITGNTYAMKRKNGKIHVYFNLLERRKPKIFKATAETLVDILATHPRPDEVLLIQEGDLIFLIPKTNYSHSTFTAAAQVKH